MCYYNYFGVTYLLAATIMLHKGVSYNFAYLKAFYPLFLIYMLPDCQVPFAFTMLLQLCWCHVFVSCNIKGEGVQPQTFFIPFSVTIGFPASPVFYRTKNCYCSLQNMFPKIKICIFMQGISYIFTLNNLLRK